MPKIRALKPSFFTDERIVELSPLARLLYQGMWVYACDNGHLEDKPRQLKLRILPADDCNVSELLSEVVDNGLAVRASGWLTIPTLTDHQRPDKRYFLTCDFPGCKEGKPVLTTRREAPPEPDECPPDPLSEHVENQRGHVGATTGPRGVHGGATSSPSTDGDGDGDGDGDEKTSSSEVAARRPDIAALLDHLDRNVEANGFRRANRTKKQVDAARLILDRDGRPLDEAHRLIEWATSDEFWRPNIRSMSKFREKYDQLKGAAMRGPRPGGRQQQSASALEAIRRRASERAQPHLIVEGSVA